MTNRCRAVLFLIAALPLVACDRWRMSLDNTTSMPVRVDLRDPKYPGEKQSCFSTTIAPGAKMEYGTDRRLEGLSMWVRSADDASGPPWLTFPLRAGVRNDFRASWQGEQLHVLRRD
jgi:hypothetical protein